MKTYELCLGDQTLDELLDRIATNATFVVPGLGRERARAIADVMFRSRVAQTTSCGRSAACEPRASLWGDRSPPAGPERPCRWIDIDPYDLPNIFAVTAADAVDLDGDARDAAEGRLAGVFRNAIGPLLFHNERCGHATACLAPDTDPFLPSPARRT
jgi:hypothetical protein